MAGAENGAEQPLVIGFAALALVIYGLGAKLARGTLIPSAVSRRAPFSFKQPVSLDPSLIYLNTICCDKVTYKHRQVY